MEKATRRIARCKRSPLSAGVRWSGLIVVLAMFAAARGQMVTYNVPTNDWLRLVEKEQAAQQQMHHEMAVAAYRQTRLHQRDEPKYEMCPVQPRPTRYRLVPCPAPTPQRLVQNQGHWNPPRNSGTPYIFRRWIKCGVATFPGPDTFTSPKMVPGDGVSIVRFADTTVLCAPLVSGPEVLDRSYGARCND